MNPKFVVPRDCQTKPIVLIKLGVFKKASKQHFPHIINWEDAIYDAVFRRAGIVRARPLTISSIALGFGQCSQIRWSEFDNNN
jgi:acyl-CoA synthetase (NDP forming)